ncbi:hypothetical protein JCM8547_006499 [Rhodosporidiobolus lusitaniae]
MNNYRPQLFIRTSDVTVGLTFPEGTESPDEKMVMPGDNVEARRLSSSGNTRPVLTFSSSVFLFPQVVGELVHPSGGA